MLYQKFAQERAKLDEELIEERRQVEALVEQTRNLKYNLETCEMRCQHFEQAYESQKQELSRSVDEEKNARQRQLQAEIDKQAIQQMMDKECAALRR